MSNDPRAIAIESIEDIREAFNASMARLNMSSYKVDVDNEKHPVEVVTHPGVLLSRLAMRAEEIAILVYGVRLFPNACYLVSNESPCGMIIQHFEDLSFDQQTDINIQQSQEREVATLDTLTRGLMGMILDRAIGDTFEIDPKQKLVKIKPHNMVIHGLFKITQEYQDGQGLPLLDANMVALSDLQGMLMEEEPLLALNKAREKAFEMEQLQRQRFERLAGLEGGVDGL
ncbi:hypothetical protein RBE51_19520 [Pseudomonas taiwanensis]|uniref:hypothetical protein n=1 Tax=Pseudomonas taiwanensis TaxID=470150 RepID=UPI0028DDB61A|nr:hypothetical protein [Pseudomonas taiwanensis]MDT8924981.1 hypothetical protein [Pseudomonas taiwanensis]